MQFIKKKKWISSSRKLQSTWYIPRRISMRLDCLLPSFSSLIIHRLLVLLRAGARWRDAEWGISPVSGRGSKQQWRERRRVAFHGFVVHPSRVDRYRDSRSTWKSPADCPHIIAADWNVPISRSRQIPNFRRIVENVTDFYGRNILIRE